MLHPQGAAWGIANPIVAVQFGFLVSYWWHVEEQMIYLLDELITGAARKQYGLDLSARQIFRSITSQDGRVKLMRNLLETLPHNSSKSSLYDEMLDEFASINSQRNKYVHGIWTTDLGTGQVRLRKATIQHEVYEGAVTVLPEEVQALTNRMQTLYTRVAVRNQPEHPQHS